MTSRSSQGLGRDRVSGRVERRVLASGMRVLLRPVRPSDAGLLVRGFERLSPESRYRRFFAHKRALQPEEIRRFTAGDEPDHFAVAAVREDPDGVEEGLGVGRVMGSPDEPGSAEAAVTVIDAFQQLGLGTLIVERLLAEAAERKLPALQFCLLAENEPMLAILRKLAPGTHAVAGEGFDRSVVTWMVPVPALAPVHRNLPRATASSSATQQDQGEPMQTIYTAHAKVEGGRAGKGRSSDGRLEVGLSTPKTLGGDDGPGTNPEQLFAVGYASCFESALRMVARGQKIALPPGSGIESSVALQKEDAGAFRLGVELKGTFPGLPREQGEKLMRDAHQVCPYSNATRGNIDVKLSVG